MRFGLSDTSLKMIKSTLSSFENIEKAAIFGSRAIGNYKKGSDVDLVVFGEYVDYDLLNTLTVTLNEVLPLPYYFDVLCYNLIESSELKRHIDEYGVLLYEKTDHL